MSHFLNELNPNVEVEGVSVWSESVWGIVLVDIGIGAVIVQVFFSLEKMGF